LDYGFGPGVYKPLDLGGAFLRRTENAIVVNVVLRAVVSVGEFEKGLPAFLPVLVNVDECQPSRAQRFGILP